MKGEEFTTDVRVSPGHERIMEILVYLLDEMRQHKQLAEIDLGKLSAAGFTQTEISTAFSWLFDKIAVTQKDPASLGFVVEHQTLSAVNPQSFRVYHEIERNVLTRGAQGYLLQLRELGLMTETEIELLIDRILMSGIPSITTNEIKELAAGVIFDFEDATRTGSRMMLNVNDTVQ